MVGQKRRGVSVANNAFKANNASKANNTTSKANNAFKAGAASRPTSNAFDTKVNKTKFNVLNRHVIGTKGKPTQARTRSVEVRKKTLIPELSRRGRTGEFVDRRFGERNRDMSAEDKMLERFSRERIRKSKKKSVFNLNDDAAENDYSLTTLTHRGKSLDDLDSFDSDVGGSEDDDNGLDLDADLVRDGHFGGPADGGKRSKAEIMQEVIAKSKMHKYERQRIKEETAAMCEDLDQDFAIILGNLETRDAHTDRQRRGAPDSRERDDDYYESVRALAFDKRANASDRTRTAEEVQKAASEKERAEQDAKKRRMLDELEPDLEEAEEEGPDANCLTDHERGIRQVMEQARQHLRLLQQTSQLAAADMAYSELAKLCRTNSVIPVARVIRQQLDEIVQDFTRALEKGSAPAMPDKETLLLFHFIGRIFSTSDYHHIVATPAQLLMSAYLHRGRLLKRHHIMSALFLIQTFLSYQKDSRRICPELLALLAPLLHKTFALPIVSNSPFPTERFMSRTVHEFLTDGTAGPVDPKPISYEDLANAFDDGESIGKDAIAANLLHLVKEAVLTYQSSVAAPELLGPILEALKANQSTAAFAEPLKSLIATQREKRVPLLLQKFKAIAIPQLVPDLDDGPSREERQQNMLKRAYRREFRGAKRELRRDSAFLAQHKLQRRVEDDRKYQERIRQIVGSISNEGSQPKRKRTSK